MKIVHVIPRLHRGGATRSTVDLAHALCKITPTETWLVVLGSHEPQAVEWARRAGIRVILPDEPETRSQVLRDADVVHVAFWNTPEMYAWLASPLPSARLVVTFHVGGEFPAQVITPQLLDLADWIVVTTPYSLTLPVFHSVLSTRPSRVHTILDSTFLPDAIAPRTGPFRRRIGYAGTVDFVKMHPRFIELCGAVEFPGLLFPVAGDGMAIRALQRQAEQVGIGPRFEWLGFLDDLPAFLASCDIFGYPLRPDTYASSEIVLQEAMWQGIPPVILPFGGLSSLVIDNETGLVTDEKDYPIALEILARDSANRARLGANAREYARQHFGADKSAAQLQQVYEQAMQVEKRERTWQAPAVWAGFPGASALIRAFGDHSQKYRASLVAADADSTHNADSEIARVSPVEYNAGGGGVLDYRNTYPDDAMLRLWSGLVLAAQGHFALAAVEFHAAKRLGLGSRAARYLERTLDHKPLFPNDP